jgi:indole-3-glycerol phosphate synthase
VVVESGIETREQVLEFENLGADAFLIGTSLMKSQDPVKKLRELQGFLFKLFFKGDDIKR